MKFVRSGILIRDVRRDCCHHLVANKTSSAMLNEFGHIIPKVSDESVGRDETNCIRLCHIAWENPMLIWGHKIATCIELEKKKRKLK